MRIVNCLQLVERNTHVIDLGCQVHFFGQSLLLLGDLPLIQWDGSTTFVKRSTNSASCAFLQPVKCQTLSHLLYISVLMSSEWMDVRISALCMLSSALAPDIPVPSAAHNAVVVMAPAVRKTKLHRISITALACACWHLGERTKDIKQGKN